MWPVGTPDEVAAAGLVVQSTPCCAPQNALHSQMNAPPSAQYGCPFWARQHPDGGIVECLFRNPKKGGFRGKGPKNVGVVVTLDATEKAPDALRPATGTHVMPCFLFMSTLMDRYLNQAKTGETIDVIAQEGEKMPYIEETLVANAIVGKDPIRKRTLNREFVVPAFPRLGMNDPMGDLSKEVSAKVLRDIEEEQENRKAQALRLAAGDEAGK